MQFKHPELLWALFLLLIPILIHLFQLRRFKRTPFTNVKLLQKVVSESRRSNQLKKWLLLFSRLLLLAAMVLAFSQPFSAKQTALQEKEVVIYLDDSFSMQAKTETGSLLESAVQELLKAMPDETVFSLFTNEKTYRKVAIREIQNNLLALPHTHKQLKLQEIYLKAQTLFSRESNTLKELVVISDFQSRIEAATDSLGNFENHLVRLKSPEIENIAIDSAFLSKRSPANLELTINLSASGTPKSTPISLFNKDKLIAKTAADFEETKNTQLVFTLPVGEEINGKIELSDTGLDYDNRLYFNIGPKEKINVLSVGSNDRNFLDRIFTEDEFNYSSYTLEALNYALIEPQNLIVLNELDRIPNSLQNALVAFVNNGGSLTIIPSAEADMDNYNLLLANFSGLRVGQKTNSAEQITSISFSHPLYRNVFEKEVRNFQYPQTKTHYKISSRVSNALAYQSGDPFLIAAGNVYLFASALSGENSNFRNSPLVVPTFYSMGTASLKLPALYFGIGESNEVDIGTPIPQDGILTVSKPGREFIPQQRSFASKTTLTFSENPPEDGIYAVKEQERIYKNLAFNYPKFESDLSFASLENSGASSYSESIQELFEEMEKDNEVKALWKWFVILALLFAITEILIQKYLK